MPNLFDPLSLGNIKLTNRIVMAPLTRTRAGQSHIPNELMATYYAQRASSGLMIAEATMIMKNTSAFVAEPGIYDAEQAQAWKQVTQAVHENKGKIFVQLWHGGRACHPVINDGDEPVAPSAIAITGDQIHTPQGKMDYVVPRALTTSEIHDIIHHFKLAAQNAKQAGFDGVELHGANGYLIDQFLRSSTNQRQDEYGGSLENRCRFLMQCLEAVIEAWGDHKVGLRLSPINSYNDISDQDPISLVSYLGQALNRFPLAYVHLMRGDFAGINQSNILSPMREAYQGILIGNMGYSVTEANLAIETGQLDAVAFGVPFIANPDLPMRFQKNLPLNQANPATFYSPGPVGYIDYPYYSQQSS